MKRIVICCDGTWNTPDQVLGGRPCPTNVTKIAEAVAPRARDGVLQATYYQRGVGTAPWERIRGGAFGWGLSRNIVEAYRWLVATYEPGDEIFLFGYSRGAYTARSLGGLIRNCGVIRREHAARIEAGYRLYRKRDSHPGERESTLFRKSYSHEGLGEPTRIKFVGVFDTVGALGIPLGILGALSRRMFGLEFHDVELSGIVEHAYQALAIDEKRKAFEPTLWVQPRLKEGQVIEQTWFAGVHGNAGGGCRDDRPSDEALRWMLAKASACGLEVNEDHVRHHVHKRCFGRLSESRKGIYRLSPPYLRPVCAPRAGLTHEGVHPSVLERQHIDPTYRPANASRALVEAWLRD